MSPVVRTRQLPHTHSHVAVHSFTLRTQNLFQDHLDSFEYSCPVGAQEESSVFLLSIFEKERRN